MGDDMLWRDIEKEKPVVDGNYLCLVNGCYCVLAWHMGGWEVEENDAIEVSYDMAYLVLTGKPTHWMPLPDPPPFNCL